MSASLSAKVNMSGLLALFFKFDIPQMIINYLVL